jgi:hypothetical protein
MKGKTGLRKKRGKQPRPYWRWQEEGSGGRWWHPRSLLKAGLATAATTFAAGFLGLFVGRWAGDWLYTHLTPLWEHLQGIFSSKWEDL